MKSSNKFNCFIISEEGRFFANYNFQLRDKTVFIINDEQKYPYIIVFSTTVSPKFDK
jgi:hypothetical protein